MYDLNLALVNHALVKAIKLLAACKRMVGRKSEAYEDLGDIDQEVRLAAEECQRVLRLLEEEAKRPLISGKSGG